MKHIERQFVESVLHEKASNLRITFTKADGQERSMRCTLATDRIPVEKHPKESKGASSTDYCRVFDLDKNEWRSFRWDRLTSVHIEYV
jgi:hypothetical protein